MRKVAAAPRSAMRHVGVGNSSVWRLDHGITTGQSRERYQKATRSENAAVSERGRICSPRRRIGRRGADDRQSVRRRSNPAPSTNRRSPGRDNWVEMAQRRFRAADASARRQQNRREKSILLSAPAAAILAGLPHIDNNEHVIAGERDGKPLAGLDKIWARIRRRAGLEDVRVHDLRHSYASFGAGASFGLPILGALLGHREAQTTLRYSHLSADPLRHASDTIGAAIAAAMKGNTGQKALKKEPGN